jgi:hypothetical protein
LCTHYGDDYDGGGGGGGGYDSECHLNGVVGRYEFLTPREFCTFSGNDYGCSPDGLSCRIRVCVFGGGFDFKYEELPLECWFP